MREISEEYADYTPERLEVSTGSDMTAESDPQACQDRLWSKLEGATSLGDVLVMSEDDEANDTPSRDDGQEDSVAPQEGPKPPELSQGSGGSGSGGDSLPRLAGDSGEEGDDGDRSEVVSSMQREVQEAMIASELTIFREAYGKNPEFSDEARVNWRRRVHFRDYVRYAAKSGNILVDEHEGAEAIASYEAPGGTRVTVSYSETLDEASNLFNQFTAVELDFTAADRKQEKPDDDESTNPLETMQYFLRLEVDGDFHEYTMDKVTADADKSVRTSYVSASEVSDLLNIVQQLKSFNEGKDLVLESKKEELRQLPRYHYTGPVIEQYGDQVDVSEMDAYLDSMPSAAGDLAKFTDKNPPGVIKKTNSVRSIVKDFCDSLGFDVLRRQRGVDYVHVYPLHYSEQISSKVAIPEGLHHTVDLLTGHQFILNSGNDRSFVPSIARATFTDVMRKEIELQAISAEDGIHVTDARPSRIGYHNIETGEFETITNALTELTATQIMRDYVPKNPNFSTYVYAYDYVVPKYPYATVLMDSIISRADNPEELYQTLQKGLLDGPDTVRELETIVGQEGLRLLATMRPDEASVRKTAAALGYANIFPPDIITDRLLHWLRPLPPKKPIL